MTLPDYLEGFYVAKQQRGRVYITEVYDYRGLQEGFGNVPAYHDYNGRFGRSTRSLKGVLAEALDDIIEQRGEANE